MLIERVDSIQTESQGELGQEEAQSGGSFADDVWDSDTFGSGDSGRTALYDQ